MKLNKADRVEIASMLQKNDFEASWTRLSLL